MKTDLIVHNDKTPDSENSEVEDDSASFDESMENNINDQVDEKTEDDVKILLNLNGEIELPSKKKNC